MGNLFWKIFLWFWLTLVLIAVAASWGTAIYLQNSSEFQNRDLRSRYLNNRIELLSQVIYNEGEDAAAVILEDDDYKPRRIKLLVVDENNQDILGRSFKPDNPRLTLHEEVESIDGATYQILSIQNPRKARSLTRIFQPFKRNPSIYLIWLSIAILFSGLVCFGLARYLSQPIRKLQLAAQKLSQGELDTRVSESIGNRRDEIADLGQGFDQMAERLQHLVNNQKQLLSDISHELRSPLARMQLAIGLTRKKIGSGAPSEMNRIEQEAERLDQLVGQSLTLSRLDAGAAYAKDDHIDIGKLLENIVTDCNFEATEKNKRVTLDITKSFTIQANGELLHRALENIVRNAIHYTKVETSVDVTLNEQSNGSFMITITDQGDGVPADKIAGLFEPFARLSQSRNRDSGGYGLGLAIAKRAIKFHQGNISASNNISDGKSGGLSVEVVLPSDKH